jgi:hypothetical protein
MITIYVVGGQTGMYDDKQEWEICSYLTEEEAKKHTDAANGWAEKRGLHCRHESGKEKYSNPFDPRGHCDWITGVQYEFWTEEINPIATFAAWCEENGVVQ